jgi:hypothetical protein
MHTKHEMNDGELNGVRIGMVAMRNAYKTCQTTSLKTAWH